MGKVDLKVMVKGSVQSYPTRYNEISVELNEVDVDEIIPHIEIREFIDYFGIDKVLDEIGESECKGYFGLDEED